MRGTEEMQELADAVLLLAHALEDVASGLGNFQATDYAQIAKELADAVSASIPTEPQLADDRFEIIPRGSRHPERASHN